jgi:hypothetical protein
LPFDTIPSSARQALAEINDVISIASAERDEAQRAFEPRVGPAQQLLAMIAQHRAGLKLLAEPDDQVYASKMLELRDIERQIDSLRPNVDMDAYRAAESALQEANSRVAALAARREGRCDAVRCGAKFSVKHRDLQ